MGDHRRLRQNRPLSWVKQSSHVGFHGTFNVKTTRDQLPP
jgi:hypothetical protein